MDLLNQVESSGLQENQDTDTSTYKHADYSFKAYNSTEIHNAEQVEDIGATPYAFLS